MTGLALSDKQIQKLAGPPTRIFLYSQLEKLRSIDELISPEFPKVALLYIAYNTDESIFGHWIGLQLIGDSVQFFDSYGGLPDIGQMKYIPERVRRETGQTHSILNNLIRGSRYNHIEYNSVPLQSKKPSIATCGRFVGYWLRLGIPVDDFARIIKILSKELRKTPDEVIVILTNGLF